ncbi:MAG TPA: plastocyanin/azurin family copper-binding protein [Nitrosopumilaceae archaeon]|nr:plastocyanin/azurin family copper-binding protein [Nitrosopumilaceae archaeon]
MKIFLLIIGLFLGSIVFSAAYASSSLLEIKGTGGAVLNGQDPKLYTATFRMILADKSTILMGSVMMRGNDAHIYAKFVTDKWAFSYAEDGSFHGEGPVQTQQGEIYNVVLDGNRVFATNFGSMWKISAIMQGNDKNFVINYLVTGKDPYPTVNVSTSSKVLIPNGNSALANTGFFIPLNLEAIRGTTVVWQNEDNIGHTVQSQDDKGNIISLFNSNVLKTGDTFSYKFDKPGVYHYFCTIHPWRIGIVTVS